MSESGLRTSEVEHGGTRTQVFVRFVPNRTLQGNDRYLVDLLNGLAEAGIEVEVVIVDRTPTAFSRLPADLDARIHVVARHSVRVGRSLIRLKPVSAIPVGLLRPVYGLFRNLLPARLRSGLRQAGARAGMETRRTPLRPDEHAFVRRQAERFKPGAVIVNYAFFADVLDVVAPVNRPLRIIITHDVLHQQVALFRSQGLTTQLDWTESVEREHLSKADVLVAIQDEDAAEFRRMVPTADVVTAPMPSIVAEHGAAAQEPGTCLFVGSRGRHNVAGLEWFLKDVWPAVLVQAPDARLRVCGSVCESVEGAHPRVTLVGLVPSLDAEYARAQVCLVPLTFGTGLKLKLVEALGHGRACVCTTTGAQGLGSLDGTAIVVADEPAKFANAVSALLRDADRRRSMEVAAHRYVADHLSRGAVYRPLVDRIRRRTRPATALPQKPESGKVAT